MVRLYMLLFLIGLFLTMVALISVLSAEAGEVRALPRPVWVVVILLVPIVGPIWYLYTGRPMPPDIAGAGPGGAGGTGGGARIWRTATGLSTKSPQVLAPDDDAEFLRGIDTRSRAKDDELLRRMEEDLRQRDDDPRKRDKSSDDSPSDG
jgi:hypothetical protein